MGWERGGEDSDKSRCGSHSRTSEGAGTSFLQAGE